TLNAGVLYTPTLTRDGLNPELVRGIARIPLFRLAGELAAAIELTTENVVIAWSELGEPQPPITLPRSIDAQDPTTRYTILLMNDPPISSPPPHDELDRYYKVLRRNGFEIPNPERFRLEIPYPHKTDEIPCLSVLLNP